MTVETTRLIVMIFYLAFLISVGLYQGRKVKSDADYQIGGRSIPGWVAALSERATAESAFLMVGFPGLAYTSGMLSIWPAIGLAIGNILAYTTIARKMQEESHRVEAVTFIDWVAKRHPRVDKAVRLIGAFIVVFIFLFYIEAQILGGGKTLSSMFGIPPVIGMLLTALIVMPYACYGGYQSVVYTGCIQSILMITTLVIAPIAGMLYIRTNSDTVYATSVFEALRSVGLLSSTGGLKGIASGIFIGNSLSWMFAYLGGLPHVNVRYMSIKDAKEMKTAQIIGISWEMVAYVGAIMLGFVGIAMFGPNTLADPETVMPQVIMTLFPPAFGALLITSSMAALLSTAESMLILAASELSEDILKPLIFKGKINSKQSLWISRLVTIILGFAAFGLVFVLPTDLVYGVVAFAWAGLGAAFSSLTLLTLFWKEFNGYGAIAAMIVGLLTTIVWYFSPLEQGITSMFIGFVASLIGAYVATIVTQKQFEESTTIDIK